MPFILPAILWNGIQQLQTPSKDSQETSVLWTTYSVLRVPLWFEQYIVALELPPGSSRAPSTPSPMAQQKHDM